MSDRDELGKTQLSMPTRAPEPTQEREALPTEHAGRYVVPEGVTDPELGRGGMGRVTVVHDTHLGREVAIKELHPQHSAERSSSGAYFESLFLREARVLARLEHPGIVPVYELGRRPDGSPYYAMRRIRGDSLHAVERRCVTLDERLALLSHFVTVVQTVGYAHSRGVVHRDLKPENVMVSRFGETQVIDWGLALVAGQPIEGELTAGTPAYMAPEQGAGRTVDARSDVWSLGVMLFELLTGRLPFEASDSLQLLHAVQTREPPDAKTLEPRVPAALLPVLRKALQKDPARRYADAGEMADALEAAQRARAPRPVALQVSVAVLGLTVLGLGLLARHLSVEADQARAQATREVWEAQTTAEDARAKAALVMLRARDVTAARQLAADVEAPLARGVAALAAEAGAPRRLFSVKPNAGCAAVAATARLVACATFGGVELYGLEGTPAGLLSTGPRGWQHAVVARADGTLVSGGDDRLLHVWDPATQQELRQQAGFSAPLRALAVDGEDLILGMGDGLVLRLRADGTSEEVARHPRPVTSVAAFGGRVASVSEGLLRVSGQSPLELSRHVGAVAFVDLTHLLLGVERAVVRLDDDRPTVTFEGARDEVTAVAQVKARVVSGSRDGTLRWWFDNGRLEGQLSGFAPGIEAMVATADGVLVATVDKRLERWALPDRLPVPEPGGVPNAWAWWPDGEVVVGLRDGHVRRLTRDGQSLELEVRHTAPVRAVVRVPGERSPTAFRFLSAGDDGRVLAQRWNGEVETLDSLPGARVQALAVSRDGQLAAWSADDGTRVLWSLGPEKERLRAQDTPALALAFSPDGRTLALGREDKHVELLDTESGRSEVTQPFDGAVTALAFSPDGQTLAVGCRDGQLALRHGAVQRRFDGPARLDALAFSADGETLGVGADDGSARLYLTGALQQVMDFPADVGPVRLVTFDEDTMIYVGSDLQPHRSRP